MTYIYTKMLHTSSIARARFQINGTDDILSESNASITSFELFRGGEAQSGGLYDAHLGTTDHGYKCRTCFNNKKNCLGHPGHMLLRYPMISPMAFTDMRKWLKIICFNCGNPIIDPRLYSRISRLNRLDEASKIARSGSSSKKCIVCGVLHPIVKKDDHELLVLWAEIVEDGKVINKWKLYPHLIKQILERVPDSVVSGMGKPWASHPRKFLLDAIMIPPTTIRPDVKKLGGGRSTNDDLTTMLQSFIKQHDKLPTAIGAHIDDKLSKSIYELNGIYSDFIKGSGNRVITSGISAAKSLASRIRGKQGRFRRNLMGKRVWKCARSTITGDPTLKIDEVGVPINMARALQVEEVVQEYNKERLLTYFFNGTKRYPGCTKIIQRSTGAEFSVDNLRNDFELQIGDRIFRDLITGDPVTINRQPSLKPSNIGCHRVVVSDNPNILTLRINVIACKLYDADFDGDL